MWLLSWLANKNQFKKSCGHAILISTIKIVFVPLSNRTLHRVLKNVGWLTADRLIRILSGVFIEAWVTRYLGPSNIGKLTFSNSLAGVFSVIASLGLDGIVVRDLVQKQSSKQEILGTACLLQFLAGILSYAALNLSVFALRPGDFTLQILAAIVGTKVLFTSASFSKNWFQHKLESKLIVWPENLAFILFAGVKVILIKEQASVNLFALAIAGESLTSAVFMLTIFDRFGIKLKALEFKLDVGKKLLSRSWPLLLSSALVILHMNIDNIMLMKYAGAEQTGIYAPAYNLMAIFFFIPVAIVTSIGPLLDERKKTDPGRLAVIIYKFSLPLIAITFVISAFLFLFADDIVVLVYGQSFTESASSLRIMCWSLVFVSIVSLRTKLLTTIDKLFAIPVMSLIGLVINVTLLYLLIPPLGSVGAAIACTMSWVANFSAYFILPADFTHRQGSKQIL